MVLCRSGEARSTQRERNNVERLLDIESTSNVISASYQQPEYPFGSERTVPLEKPTWDPSEDAIAWIVEACRAFVSYPLVYCDSTASRRKAYVLTIKCSRVGAAVRPLR